MILRIFELCSVVTHECQILFDFICFYAFIYSKFCSVLFSINYFSFNFLYIIISIFYYIIFSILLPGLKFYANIPRCFGIFVQEGWQKYTLHLGTGNWITMSIVLDTKKSNFGGQQWLWFRICFIMTLYYKMRQILQNTKTILLRNATKVCYKNA